MQTASELESPNKGNAIESMSIDDDGETIQRITTSGKDNELVHIGPNTYRRSEFMEAFGGELRPGIYTPSTRKLGNPSALGLFAYSSCAFLSALYTIHAGHVTNASILIGAAWFLGFVGMLVAGILELIVENTFGFVTLCSYSLFWGSYAAISTNSFGIMESYTDPGELNRALALYLFMWWMLTFMFMLCTLKSTVGLFGLFFTLQISFLVQAIGTYLSDETVIKASGWIFLVNCAFGYYNAYSGLATRFNTWIVPIAIPMPGHDKGVAHSVEP